MAINTNGDVFADNLWSYDPLTTTITAPDGTQYHEGDFIPVPDTPEGKIQVKGWLCKPTNDLLLKYTIDTDSWNEAIVLMLNKIKGDKGDTGAQLQSIEVKQPTATTATITETLKDGTAITSNTFNLPEGQKGDTGAKLATIVVNQPTSTTATITETLTDDTSVVSNTFNLPQAPRLQSIQVNSNPETAMATMVETLTDNTAVTSNEFELARGKEGKAGKEISNIDVTSTNQGATTDIGFTFQFNDGTASDEKHATVQNGVVENLSTINGERLDTGGDIKLQKPITLVPNSQEGGSGDTNADLDANGNLRIWDPQFESSKLVKNFRIAESEIAGMSDLDTDLPTTKTINKFFYNKTEVDNSLSLKANQTDLTALSSKVDTKADQSAVDTKLAGKIDAFDGSTTLDPTSFQHNTDANTIVDNFIKDTNGWRVRQPAILDQQSQRIVNLAPAETANDAVNLGQITWHQGVIDSTGRAIAIPGLSNTQVILVSMWIKGELINHYYGITHIFPEGEELTTSIEEGGREFTVHVSRMSNTIQLESPRPEPEITKCNYQLINYQLASTTFPSPITQPKTSTINRKEKHDTKN